MNPECCGREMVEVEGAFTNDLGEYEIIGYECPICGNRVDERGNEL